MAAMRRCRRPTGRSRDLGKIFRVSDRDGEDRADAQQIADVEAAVADEPPVRFFACFRGEGPLCTLGAASGLPNQLFSSPAARTPWPTDAFPKVGLESVAGADVDAYIINTSTDELEQALYTSFPNLEATKDKRYAAFNFTFSVQGWRNAQTVEDLAPQLHPGAFDE